MPDLIDEATDKAEMFRATALRTTLKASAEIPTGIGICLWCGDDVDGARRWCSPECRDLFEADKRGRR